MQEWADMLEASMEAEFESEDPPAAVAAVSDDASPATAPTIETSPDRRPATSAALGAALGIPARGTVREGRLDEEDGVV